MAARRSSTWRSSAGQPPTCGAPTASTSRTRTWPRSPQPASALPTARRAARAGRRGRDRAAPSGAGAKIRRRMTISTHILDTELGEPGAGIKVGLFRGKELISLQEADENGRIPDLSEGQALGPGEYR